LRERWWEEWQMQDRLHARTAAAFGGVKDIKDILIFQDPAPEADPATVNAKIDKAMRRLANG
jgi:hypothetical protein